MKIFYGEVHSHTDLSDGKGASENAYPFAKQEGGADYFAVTDHNTQVKDDYLDTISALADQQYEDGKFASLYGYEMSWSPGDWGHANIILPKKLFDAKRTLAQWYDDLAEIEESGVGQFNHPGERWGSFEDFRFDARMDKIFHLMELRLTEYGIFTIEEEFEKALAKGWHIGPVSNEDSHGANWTMVREETGAVLAEELTRESILDAMRAHRTYTTTDRTLKLFYQANGAWLGSIIPKTGKMEITVKASTEKPCGLGLLQLVGQFNRVLAQVDVGEAKEYLWSITIPDDQKYVYVRRIGGMQYAMTAPIWVEQEELAPCLMQVSYANQSLQATIELENIKAGDLTDICVEWCLARERIEYGTAPVAVSRVEKIEAGACQAFYATLPIRLSDTRLVAHITGRYNGMRFSCDRMHHLAPAPITQFFCNTSTCRASGFSIQPFCCFDIYNRTDLPLDLSAYTLRYVDGVRNVDAVIDRVIAPHQTLTVWMRGPSSALTLQDLNEYFGTDLCEDQVYMLPILFNRDQGRLKIGLMYGEQMVCRLWVRSREYADLAPIDGAAFRYGFSGASCSAECLGLFPNAKPGEGFCPFVDVLPSERGEAKADLIPVKPTEMRHAVCLSDGGLDEATLRSLVLPYLPSHVSLEVIIGDNTGDRTLGEYLHRDPAGILLRALQTNADTVILAMGVTDVTQPRPERYLTWNFNSFMTVMHMLGGMLRANGKRVMMLSIPKNADYDEACEKQRVSLCKSLKKAASSLGAEWLGDRAELAIAHSAMLPALTPVEGAYRIACVGDKFSLGMRKNLVSFFSTLQERLGANYDVRIYSTTASKAIFEHEKYLLHADRARLEQMKAFAPDCILVSFGNGDCSKAEAAIWNSGLAEAFSQGYREILCEMKAIAKRVIAITPFKRLNDEDARTRMVVQEGGMTERICALCSELGVEIVDMTSATIKDPSLLISEKTGFEYYSPAGNDYLASALTELIRAE